MYRKSYRGFVIWLIVFLVLLFAICFLPVEDAAIMTRLITNLCTLGMAHLTWLIWRTESVYWYNGVSFEDAAKAGAERRKAYALRHFRLFGGYALVALVVTAAAQMLHLPWWVDFTLVCSGLIVAAVRTTAYKL
ncbi:MAG: hypothetical protein IKU70_03900 [Clostridia bacterium]|nr:hypothetical protein [Clostridia bacterium]